MGPLSWVRETQRRSLFVSFSMYLMAFAVAVLAARAAPGSSAERVIATGAMAAAVVGGSVAMTTAMVIARGVL